MTDVTFDTAELTAHGSAMSGITSEVQGIAERADGINLGDASYGLLVGPMAASAGRLLLEGYAEVLHSLADNLDASQQVIDKTRQVYTELEEGNAGNADRMV